MVPRRALLISLGVLAAAAASPALARSGLPQGLDKNSDGTLDLDEAEKAAGETFEKLDQNHDGTLDARELHAKLSKGEIAAADLDKDKTLTRRNISPWSKRVSTPPTGIATARSTRRNCTAGTAARC